MVLENGPQRSLPSWREGASAWIVSAILIAGLMVSALFTEKDRYIAASQGGLTAPVATNPKTARLPTD